MKKIAFIMLSAIIIFSLAACGSKDIDEIKTASEKMGALKSYVTQIKSEIIIDPSNTAFELNAKYVKDGDKITIEQKESSDNLLGPGKIEAVTYYADGSRYTLENNNKSKVSVTAEQIQQQADGLNLVKDFNPEAIKKQTKSKNSEGNSVYELELNAEKMNGLKNFVSSLFAMGESQNYEFKSAKATITITKDGYISMADFDTVISSEDVDVTLRLSSKYTGFDQTKIDLPADLNTYGSNAAATQTPASTSSPAASASPKSSAR